VPLRVQPEVEVISLLCAASMGFTLHAATTVSAHDMRASREEGAPTAVREARALGVLAGT